LRRGIAAWDFYVETIGMYLRPSTRKKDGKTHVYWRLVRSVRRGGKVVQQTVAQLGELDAAGRARARLLARRITGGAEQRELFEQEPEETTVAVQMDRVRLERSRSFGDVYLGWKLWCGLELDEELARLLPAGRERVPWSTMVSLLVLARLCEPSSELSIAERWYRGTALEEMLGVPSTAVNDDRLYRALDRLLPHKETLERHLRAKLGELFELDYDLLLYDVTSTYFEGLSARNAQARRGYSRDHRPDCQQVCLALVVTREGLPLGYEVFAGNRVDVTTVEEIVGTMEQRFGLAQRIWVMDRGMVSQANVAWLQKTGRRYLLGASRSELRRWKQELLDARDWRVVREGVEVKLCSGPEGAETFVLCRSQERSAKEKAMHERFSARIEAELTVLRKRIAAARAPLARGELDRQIGRLLERNRRAAQRFQIELAEDPSQPSGLRLDWSVRVDWDAWAQASEGCYVLRTNIANWTPDELWHAYIQLTQAEAAFHIQKADLALRPIWHQKEERVQAHILVCFLAYVLWKTLEQWASRAGLGHSARTILAELAQIRSADVVLPTAEPEPRELRLRCVVRPDPSQAYLLDRLGLRLPERLRIPL
jgi:transposase